MPPIRNSHPTKAPTENVPVTKTDEMAPVIKAAGTRDSPQILPEQAKARDTNNSHIPQEEDLSAQPIPTQTKKGEGAFILSGYQKPEKITTEPKAMRALIAETGYMTQNLLGKNIFNCPKKRRDKHKPLAKTKRMPHRNLKHEDTKEKQSKSKCRQPINSFPQNGTAKALLPRERVSCVQKTAVSWNHRKPDKIENKGDPSSNNTYQQQHASVARRCRFDLICLPKPKKYTEKYQGYHHVFKSVKTTGSPTAVTADFVKKPFTPEKTAAASEK